VVKSSVWGLGECVYGFVGGCITVARKGRPGKKQTGWCSDNKTGGGVGKTER
jgi:hypothetical protein